MLVFDEHDTILGHYQKKCWRYLLELFLIIISIISIISISISIFNVYHLACVSPPA